MADYEISDAALAQILAALRLLQAEIDRTIGNHILRHADQREYVRGRIPEYFQDHDPYTIAELEGLITELALGNAV